MAGGAPSLAAPRPRRRLSVTSLIDVIFLLLIFFMLSSTFSRFAEIEIGAAAGGGAAAVAGTTPLFLQLGEAELALNGQPVAPEALAAEIGEEAQVIVSLRDGVTAQRLADVLVALRAAPGATVTVLAP
jgi:biopolymer transport protein ExbD